MSENRAVMLALGLGSLVSLAGAAVLLTPGKALAQVGCGTGGPLCYKSVTCWEVKNGICVNEETIYRYYPKGKT